MAESSSLGGCHDLTGAHLNLAYRWFCRLSLDAPVRRRRMHVGPLSDAAAFQSGDHLVRVVQTGDALAFAIYDVPRRTAGRPCRWILT